MSVSLAALVAAPLILAGCPDGMTTGPELALLSVLADTTPSIDSDGRATVRFSVRAFNAAGGADDTGIEVSVASGTLSSAVGTVDADQRRVTLMPTSGEASFEYMCEPFSEGAFQITANNGVAAQNTATVTCTPPTGSVTAQVITSACTGANELQATSTASCVVTGTVSLTIAGDVVPQENATLTIEVQELRDIILPDGTTSENPEQDGREEVLSTDGENRFRIITIVTDSNGDFSFFVHATLVENLQQVMTFGLTGLAQAGALVVDESTFTIPIVEFDNQSEVEISADLTQVVGGATITLTVQATGVTGQPADSATILVRVIDDEAEPGNEASFPDAAGADGGVAGGTTITLTTDANGGASATLIAPTLQPGDGPRTLSLEARYAPLPGLPAATATETVTVNPEGTLLVNVIAEPNVIRSDDNESSTITVNLQKNGEPIDFDVEFTVTQEDIERVGFGVRPADVPPGDNSLPAISESFVEPGPGDLVVSGGSASAILSTQNNRVRGVTTVLITVTDDDEVPEVTYTEEIQIEVDRAPILQSIVFVSAAPETIGVLGSSKASSSSVVFKVLDDLNNPIENVSVNFSVPDTADPDASVVGNDLTGPTGEVSTVLSAGTRAQSIVVVAEATYEGTTLSVESDPIAVTGGLVNYAQSYITCDPSATTIHGGFTIGCNLNLVDRFTNVTPNVAVQFRAEGGSITPNVSGTEPATYVSSAAPTSGRADMAAWSYGGAIPGPNDLSDPAEYAGCFDNSSQTRCDVMKMCIDGVGNDPIYCPLPIFERENAAGTPVLSNCWDDTPPILLALLGIETGGCIVSPGMPATIDCPGQPTLMLPTGVIDQVLYNTNATIQGLVEQYKDRQHDCGYMYSCLAGDANAFGLATAAGLSFIFTDDCPIAPGCLDFSSSTLCPHDSLLTITGSVRGEEGFVDKNGNGVFDFDDANANGEHDPGESSEAFIDMPETFLDKNDNCFFDELDGSLRLEASTEVQLSDQFSDEDNSNDWGYSDPAAAAEAPRARTNRKWDRDKELFFSASIIHLNSQSPILVAGEACPDAAVQAGNYTCSNGNASVCNEFTNGNLATAAIAPGCLPQRLVHPEIIAANPALYANDLSIASFDFTFTDFNGNCWNSGGAATYGVEAQGGLEVNDPGGAMRNLCRGGISDRGNAYGNPRRPFCGEAPRLGVSLTSTTVKIDCAAQADDEHIGLSEVLITHSGEPGDTAAISITTICPICGDGYVTGDELCDPQDGINYTPLGCTATCELEDPTAGG